MVFKFIGFADTRVENVEVIIDRTTEINAEMKESVIEGEEVTVVAERPIVEKDRTTTTSYVSSEEIEDLPVQSVNDVVNLQAGVVEGHFRGGRIGEVAYVVNGVPINNSYTNSAGFEVEQNMVSSLEVISGVFKLICACASQWVRNLVPRAGLLGSLTAIALVLICFLPLLDILQYPVVGLAALAVILTTLVAKVAAPLRIPGACEDQMRK